ncbi:hypothetical protein PMAYCL1PPCAC_19897, partial [Pristionchus mayeri]
MKTTISSVYPKLGSDSVESGVESSSIEVPSIVERVKSALLIIESSLAVRRSTVSSRRLVSEVGTIVTSSSDSFVGNSEGSNYKGRDEDEGEEGEVHDEMLRVD